MKSITVKVDEKTEKKMSEWSTEEQIAAVMKFHGASKVKTTDEENRITREIVSEEYFKELEKRFK